MNLFQRRFLILLVLLFPVLVTAKENTITYEINPNQIPILRNSDQNPVIRIAIKSEEKVKLKSINIDFNGSTNYRDIQSIEVFYTGKDTVFKGNKLLIMSSKINKQIELKTDFKLNAKVTNLWISIKLHREANLLNRLHCKIKKLSFSKGAAEEAQQNRSFDFRYGHALRKFGQDGIHTSRIPGLATSENGTLLAIFDARREHGRDLQGDIDIGLQRSFDNGNSWEPVQVIMDMGEWGGLPEKFNGVSDANIIVHGNDIYVAGLWMHGVIDKHGDWQEDLNEKSKDWNHQWKTRGSQPGFGVKQTSQFLMVKSNDNGETWSQPINITRMCKKEKWWLWAPAPGRGIVMDDGTIVFPSQGRDENGLPFSNITYSKDSGKTWHTSNPASHNTTECSVVELEKGRLMLNIRDNRNREDKSETNGRAVYTTQDLGETWQEHPTSRHTLKEPVCMAGLYKHIYIQEEVSKHVLLFSNPNSKFERIKQTIKISYDDGATWPKDKWILLDSGKGRGYSCVTGIDNNTIGIIYEGSRAQIIYQKIDLKSYLY